MIKKVGIICKWGRPEPQEILNDLLPWLSERGIKVYCNSSGACCTGEKPNNCSIDEMPSNVDLAIVLGGDGTMLWAARIFASNDVPLLGVNLGGMGYITEVVSKDLLPTMDHVLKGNFITEKRMMLSAQHIRDGKSLSSIDALNDVIVNKGNRATIIRFEVLVDDVPITHYQADGIIIATPTGSTAYSLSAGGPILYPTLSSILLTPICPHTLTNRPIVLSGDTKVDIRLASKSEDVILTHDGLVSNTLEEGDIISIKRSENITTLIMPPDHDNFEALRTKLKWGER